MNNIDALFRKQKKLLYINLITTIIVLIGVGYVYFTEISGGGTLPVAVISLAAILFGGITNFVVWILGILNAIKINGDTKKDDLLVVFSIITIYFVGIVMTHIAHNRYSIEGITSNRSSV